jgi:nucleoside-diphosphate-sugar epimerase
VINVAAGGRVSLLELLDVLATLTGVDLPPVHGPSREGDVRDSQADISVARTLLGFAPEVSLEEGLRETLAWFASTNLSDPSR